MKRTRKKALVTLLARYPGEIAEAAKNCDPARLTRYAVDAATAFHKFYTACRCKGEEEAVMQSRLSLCLAAKSVIAKRADAAQVTVPESM